MFRGLLRPGQGFRPYTVLRREGSTTATGRPVTRELVPKGTFLGMISRASQAEQEQWKQRGHPITRFYSGVWKTGPGPRTFWS